MSISTSAHTLFSMWAHTSVMSDVMFFSIAIKFHRARLCDVEATTLFWITTTTRSFLRSRALCPPDFNMLSSGHISLVYVLPPWGMIVGDFSVPFRASSVYFVLLDGMSKKQPWILHGDERRAASERGPQVSVLQREDWPPATSANRLCSRQWSLSARLRGRYVVETHRADRVDRTFGTETSKSVSSNKIKHSWTQWVKLHVH